jgi:hypothetical protein
MDIPGAFETPYQLAPLDLGDDSFYRSRQTDIEQRLQQMTNTSTAIDMLREIDEVERERGTLAIGVNWTYGLVDLEEIITVSMLLSSGFLLVSLTSISYSAWVASLFPSCAGCSARSTVIAPAEFQI